MIHSKDRNDRFAKEKQRRISINVKISLQRRKSRSLTTKR